MKKQFFSIMVVGVLGATFIGCGSDDGTSTVTSVDPDSGKEITEQVDSKTGIKLDYLTLTPTNSGFDFRYDSHSRSTLMYETKSIYNKKEQKELWIAGEDKNNTISCEETPELNTATAIAYKCIPKNQESQSGYSHVHRFVFDENVKFFSSKKSDRILATIKYNSQTNKIEIIK
jgi:hypothetical protein